MTSREGVSLAVLEAQHQQLLQEKQVHETFFSIYESQVVIGREADLLIIMVCS